MTYLVTSPHSPGSARATGSDSPVHRKSTPQLVPSAPEVTARPEVTSQPEVIPQSTGSDSPVHRKSTPQLVPSPPEVTAQSTGSDRATESQPLN